MDKSKILVVDDESRMRKLVRDFLVKNNYEVVEAADGQQALDLFFEKNNIDLVILDVMREMSFWALSWGWMNIFPNPSARKFLWRGWRRSFAEPDRRRR